MAQNGDYPFLVLVWNRFTSSCVETGTPIPEVNVRYNHYPNGLPENGQPTEDRPEPPPGVEMYHIQPGDVLGFPLFWGPVVDDNYTTIVNGENLVITYPPDGENAPKTPYYLCLGSKANYKLVARDDSGIETELSPEGSAHYSLIPAGLGGKNSGLWIITNPSFQWTLTVTKLVPDPETTNVSIGPDLP